MNRAEKRRQQKLTAKAAKKTKGVQTAVSSSGQLLGQALEHHGAGRLPEAERMYQQILESEPNNVDALHLIGVLAHQVGKNDEAAELISKAVAINPNFAEAHSNLGLALMELGRLDNASTHFRRAIEIKPDFAEAHYNFGNALKGLGKPSAAVSSYKKAIKFKPGYALAYTNLGNVLRDLGNTDEAITNYRVTLSITPNFAEAHNNLGNALRDASQLDEAVTSYRQAISLSPQFAEAHSNLGNAYKELGRFEDAVTSYRQAITISPGFAEAHRNLGNAYEDLGEIEGAIASYRKAISIAPDFAEAYCNLGNASKRLDQLENAIVHYQRAIDIKPDYAEAYYNLGTVLMENGQVDEAIYHYLKALDITPEYPEVLNNLGNGFQALGRLEEAIGRYRQAIDIDHQFAYGHYNLGFALMALEKTDMAFTSLRKAVALEPTNGLFWSGYAICLEAITFSSFEAEQAQELLVMLDQPTIIQKRVAKPIMTLLHSHPDIHHIAESVEEGTLAKNTGRAVELFSGIPLLLRLMELTTINDAVFEKILTQIRKSMLSEVIAGDNILDIQPFHAALSKYCFCNGFVFNETLEEKQQISDLQQQIEKFDNTENDVLPMKIAVLSFYRSLSDTSFSASLLKIGGSELFEKIIVCQIGEPLEEQALRAEIPRTETIKDTTSQAVRQQYEENPYPVWIKPVFYPIAKTIRNALQDISIIPDEKNGKLPSNPEILIAGCGTGQQAIQTASRFKNARLLAVDLSLSSLSFALRKTREFGISNIDYIQCDILNLQKLDKEFDLIECRGVLHHLADPLVGWQVLAKILRPNGLMKISLYSKIARSGIRKSRKLIEEKGYSATSDGIRKFREYVLNNKSRVDLEIFNLVYSPDFYSTSECRDLVFHAQETQFTLLDIEAAINDLGLQFLGFEMPRSGVLTQFRSLNPDEDASVSLARWHEFEEENPNTFGELYEFWVQKSDQ